MLTPHDNQNPWPFPCLEVVVCAVSTRTTTPSLLAHIDTGADITLIPLTYLQGIQAEALYKTRLQNHSGGSYPVTVYLVDLEVAGHLYPGIEVVGDIYDDVPLLGRNILNKWHLFIAGPERQTTIVPPALATHTLQRLGYKE